MAEHLVTQKCAHPPCNCFATFGSKYCSDFCEEFPSTRFGPL